MLGTRAVRLAAAALLVWAATAGAQEEDEARSSRHQPRPFELNLNAGGHRPDGAEDTDVGLGGRFFYHSRGGLGLGGSFTWVISDADFGGGDVDVNTYYYGGEIEYAFPVAGPLQPFFGAGAGAATVKLSDSGSGTLAIAPAGLTLANEEDHHHDGDSETNWMVPLIGGVRIRMWENIAARLDIRNNIIWVPLNSPTGEEDGHEATHNWEVSGGVSVLWGQFRAQRGFIP